MHQKVQKMDMHHFWQSSTSQHMVVHYRALWSTETHVCWGAIQNFCHYIDSCQASNVMGFAGTLQNGGQSNTGHRLCLNIDPAFL